MPSKSDNYFCDEFLNWFKAEYSSVRILSITTWLCLYILVITYKKLTVKL